MKDEATSVRTVSATETNRQWSKLLARVERGETIEITRRGKPAGRLVPVQATSREGLAKGAR